MIIQNKALVSLSDEGAERKQLIKKIGKPPSWWLKMDLKSRERYLKQHAQSKYEPHLMTGLDENGDLTKAPEDSSKRPKKKAPVDSKEVASAKKKFSKEQIKNQRLKQQRNAKKRIAKQKNTTETTVQKLARRNSPVVQKNWKMGAAKLATNGVVFANKLRGGTSPRERKAVERFFKNKFRGEEISEGQQAVAHKAIYPLARVLLGAAVIGGMMLGAAPVIAAVTSAYADGINGAFASESSGYNDDLDTSDPMQFLVADFSRWANSVNNRVIADEIAEVMALQQFIASKQKEQGIEPGEEEEVEDGQEAEYEDDEMVSQSSTTPAGRLLINLAPGQKAKPEKERDRYLVKFNNDIIGRIDSCPKVEGNGTSNRCWVCTLKDGFDETAYPSGVQTNSPFTLATKQDVLLRNPTRMTLDEAKSWLKTAIIRRTMQ